MELTILRVIIVVLALLAIIFNRPIGRTTASWERAMGLPLVTESKNRVAFIFMGVFALAIALFI